jgi:uncharacterized membrane protein YidH (DUF202 family)
MTDPENVAESYRDLSKFYATISSGLFVATGIGASLFATSINSGLSLVRMGFQTPEKEWINATQSAEVSKVLFESSISTLKASRYGFVIMMGTTIAAIILAGEGYYNWRKSHRILLDKPRRSRRPYLIAYGLLVLFVLILMFDILLNS